MEEMPLNIESMRIIKRISMIEDSPVKESSKKQLELTLPTNQNFSDMDGFTFNNDGDLGPHYDEKS